MKKEELINAFMEFVEEKFPELVEEEAEFAVEKLKVLHELSELARPFSYESNSWCFYLNSEGVIDYYTGLENQYLYGDYYFDSMEEAIRAVEQIGEDRIKKYLFGVED